MTSRSPRFLLLAAVVGVGVFPSRAAAQGTPGTWPEFTVRVGALLADVGSDIRLDGTGGNSGTSISLVDDLGFKNQTTTFFADGIWRITRRNRIQVDYEGIRRDSSRNVAPRTITFRDETFTVGSQTQAFFDTVFLSGYYGFAFVAKPTVEVGVTIGVTLMRINSGVEIAVQAEAGQSVSRELANRTRYDVPVPLPGFFVNIRPHPRLTIVGATRVIKATFGDTTASFAEAKGAVDFIIGHGVGVGGAYYFNRSIVERENSSRNGRIEYRFNGPQAYAVFNF